MDSLIIHDGPVFDRPDLRRRRTPGATRLSCRGLGAPCCVVAALLGCTAHVLPPPPSPAPAMHTRPLPERPPTDNEGTITLDVSAGSAQVELVTPAATTLVERVRQAGAGSPTRAHNSQIVVAQPLCQTPCTVNLPRGQHMLQFIDVDPSSHRQGSAVVNVGHRPSMVRHTMGRAESPPTSETSEVLTIAGFALGVPQVVVGSVFLIAGRDADGLDLRPAGRILFGTGLFLSVMGVLNYLRGRSVIQTGSTVQWTP